MKFSRMIQAIDLHACGEPGRVIVGGVLDVPGKTMFEKMRYFETQADACASSCCGSRGAIPQPTAT